MSDSELYEEAIAHATRPIFLNGKVVGSNVDPVNIRAGLHELHLCGYCDSPMTDMVITYALQRWARGEEAAAEKGAIDTAFHGIDLTCWRRVLAAALAHA